MKKPKRKHGRKPNYTSPETLRRWVERVMALLERQKAEQKLRERIQRIVGPIKRYDAFTRETHK